MQALAHSTIALGHVVVVRAAKLDRIPRELDEADRQPLGGEHHRLLDAGLVQEGQPVLPRTAPVVARRDAPASLVLGVLLAKEVVEAIQRWKNTLSIAR